MQKQKKNIIGIYKITNLITGKVYIGQSIDVEKRKKTYEKLRCIKQPKIFNSIQKYGWENHSHEILEVCCVETLNSREFYWKNYYVNLQGWDKVLFCDLSDTNCNGPRSEEIKQKLREKMKGRVVPREVVERQKKTKLLAGYKHPKLKCEHCKQEISIVGFTRYHSDNCSQNPKNSGIKRKGVREGIKGFSNKKVEQWSKDGELIKVWDSQWEARESLGLKGDGIGACCREEQKSAGGFIWKYKEI